MSGEQYDSDYFLRGKLTGKSLYVDYHWMPELTVPMVQRIMEHLGIISGESILDFGCARGYTVKALRILGQNAYGIDISKWAIDNADENTKPYLTWTLGSVHSQYDWIIAKDVLEHIPYVHLTINELISSANKGLFVVVPLSPFNGAHYVIEDYEKDITHCQRHTLLAWASMFLRPGWSVEMSYRVPGVKDNWATKPEWAKGNGFLTVRRIAE
jgi:hypothetical protein